METVKFGRTKIKVGDCVSVPNDYFGDGYLQYMKDADVHDDCIYGRVTFLIDENRNFTVKWDFDQETTPFMSLEKVQYELIDTPLQVKPASIITAEDFEGMAGDLEQGSSTKAAETYALIVEEFGEALNDSTFEQNITTPQNTMYTLFVGDGKMHKDCLFGELIPCAPGSVVHGKTLTENQAKFLITEVLDMWESFDADFHHPGAYVAWDKDHCVEENKGGEKSTRKSVRQKKEAEEGIEVNETKRGKKGKQMQMERM